jgi:hypothetical protein
VLVPESSFISEATFGVIFYWTNLILVLIDRSDPLLYNKFEIKLYHFTKNSSLLKTGICHEICVSLKAYNF